MTEREHRDVLRKALADRIGCKSTDVSDEHLESILRILRGMYWDAKTFREVTKLAERIREDMGDGSEADRNPHGVRRVRKTPV